MNAIEKECGNEKSNTQRKHTHIARTKRQAHTEVNTIENLCSNAVKITHLARTTYASMNTNRMQLCQLIAHICFANEL